MGKLGDSDPVTNLMWWLTGAWLLALCLLPACRSAKRSLTAPSASASSAPRSVFAYEAKPGTNGRIELTPGVEIAAGRVWTGAGVEPTLDLEVFYRGMEAHY